MTENAYVNGVCSAAEFSEPKVLSDAQVNLLSELQLEISLELAAVPIGALELLDLQPGRKLSCKFEPEKVLTLKVGDEVIGRGKLVLEGEDVLLEIVSLEGDAP